MTVSNPYHLLGVYMPCYAATARVDVSNPYHLLGVYMCQEGDQLMIPVSNPYHLLGVYMINGNPVTIKGFRFKPLSFVRGLHGETIQMIVSLSVLYSKTIQMSRLLWQDL